MAKLDYDKNNIVHVYPTNDLKSHILEGFGCPCGVKIEIQPNKGVLVTHKSFDQREVYEKYKEKPSNPKEEMRG